MLILSLLMSNRRCNIISLIGVFLLIISNVHTQSVIVDTEQPITKIRINNDGRIHILNKGVVCLYEGNNIVINCISTDEKVLDVILVRDDLFYLFYDNLLLQYDENELVVVDTLPDVILCGIANDEAVYIGTADGLYKKQHNKSDIDLEILQGEFINDISLSSNATLIIALDSGLTIYDLENKSEKTISTKAIIRKVTCSDDGRYVTLSADNKVAFWDSTFFITDERLFDIGQIRDIEFNTGDLYFLSDRGAYELGKNNQIVAIAEGVYSAMIPSSNTLLLSTEDKILSYDLTSEQYISSTTNYAIYADNDSIYWLGRNKEIIQFVNDEKEKSITIPTNKKDLFVSTIAVSDSYIFAGTMGEGLFVFNKNGTLIQHHLQQDLNNRNNIIQLRILDNKLWIGYLNGVAAIDIRKIDSIIESDNIDNNNYLYAIEPIAQDEYYLGTANDGVLHVKNGKVIQYLTETTVQCLAVVDKVLYAGTEKNGIFSIEEGKVELLNASKNPIYSMYGLENILLVNEKSKSYVYDTKTKKSFPIDIGALQNSQLNGVTSDSHNVVSIFSNGILKIDKNKIRRLNSIDLHLNRPIQFNKLLPLNKSEFRYDENSITFTFHPKSYYLNQSIAYKYRLIGQDTTWQVTQRNRVDYFNLAAGDYTFEIAQGYNSDFNPQDLSQYQFKIDKPFWKKSWFALLLFLILSYLLYYIIKRRESAIINKQDRDRERLKFELDQLKNQIDPHFLFNSFNSLIGLIEEDAEKAVVATEQLSQLYRNILSFQDRDTVSVREEITIAQDYFAIHKIRFEDNIELFINLDDNVTGKVLSLSTQFLIENAIKHNVINSSNKLTITINVSDHYLVVSNNLNPKKLVESKSGYGLDNLKKRYNLFSKKVLLVENNGSSFTVKLPIIYD